MWKNKSAPLASALLFLGLVVGGSGAFAYPIVFNCTADHRLKDFVFDGDYENFVLKNYASTPDQISDSLPNLACGYGDCLKDFKNIIALTAGSEAAAQKIFDDEMQKLKLPANGITPISNPIGDLKRALVLLSEANTMCRDASIKLQDSYFVRNVRGVGDIVLLFYPFLSNYIYITGCARFMGNEPCEFNSLKYIEEGAEDAILMGVDPYLAISIGFMEHSANGVHLLNLDPVAKMSAMGCDVSVAPQASAARMNSYGGLYTIGRSVVRDASLDARIKNFLSVKSEKFSSEKSYLCRSVTSGDGEISSEPEKDKCCLQLSFKPQSSSALAAMSRALVMDNIRGSMKQGMKANTAPEYHIQRFNGYTSLMGSTEGVPNYRVGVNYFQHPLYGLQTMDFILNSVMANPKIRQVVESKQKALGQTSESILCADRLPGFYAVDSDYYFLQHRSTPRFEALANAMKDSKYTYTWSQISEAERTVLQRLFSDLIQQGKLRDPVADGQAAMQSRIDQIRRSQPPFLDPPPPPALSQARARAAELGDQTQELRFALLDSIKKNKPELSEPEIWAAESPVLLSEEEYAQALRIKPDDPIRGDFLNWFRISSALDSAQKQAALLRNKIQQKRNSWTGQLKEICAKLSSAQYLCPTIDSFNTRYGDVDITNGNIQALKPSQSLVALSAQLRERNNINFQSVFSLISDATEEEQLRKRLADIEQSEIFLKGSAKAQALHDSLLKRMPNADALNYFQILREPNADEFLAGIGIPADNAENIASLYKAAQERQHALEQFRSAELDPAEQQYADLVATAHDKFEARLATLAGTVAGPKVDLMTSYLRTYFKDIYPNEKTVGQASDYRPWKRMTPAQVNALRSRLEQSLDPARH